MRLVLVMLAPDANEGGREEPDRVGAAVTSALRQRGWSGGLSRLGRATGGPGYPGTGAPALEHAFGPALGADPAVAGLGLAAVAGPRSWA